MSEDSEYDDMVRAEKKAVRELKKAHYRLTDNPRCENCKHCILGTWPEDPNLCRRVHESQRWFVGIVSDMGICDLWVRAEDESEAAHE